MEIQEAPDEERKEKQNKTAKIDKKEEKEDIEMDIDEVNKHDPEEESKISLKSTEIDISLQSVIKPESEKEETNGLISDYKETKDEEENLTVKEFDFNIQDGGLTELHTLWYFEENELKPKHEHEIWNRRHDYWMLAGIVKHGYELWDVISADDDFAIINEPFKTSLSLRNKFMERRLRLLEQALVFEEQLRRYTHLAGLDTYIPKPKDVKDSKEVDVEQANNSEDNKKENGDIENKENDELMLNPNIQRASNQLEDLLIDMKSDCARIPQTVQRIPSIANRLQIGTPRNPNANPLAGMPQLMNRMI